MSKMEVDSDEKKTDSSKKSGTKRAGGKKGKKSGKDSKKSSKTTIVWDDFDVDAFAARYEGKVGVDRLLHVAEVVTSKKVAARALTLAADYVQRAEVIDVNLYSKVMDRAQAVLGADKIKLDTDWMQKTTLENDSKARMLEDEIQRWRNLSNREKICTSYLEAGTFYAASGAYTTAISRLMEAKSFASTATLLLDIHMRVITASIQAGTLAHVRSEASQAMSSETIFYDKNATGKALSSSGLCSLRAGRFESGISNFTGIQFSLASKWNEGLAAEDIALYGGVCALGALSRGELKRRVLDNAEFKRYLELRPDLLKLITAFYESEYGSVMEGLRLLRRELIIDPFTYAAVDSLLTAIRGKALVQYFSPYSVMDMNRMAEAFNVSQAEMEKELSICIANGHINAKIDSHSKIVYAAKHDKRRKLFLAISKLGDDFERDIVGVLLRMSLQKQNIAVSQTREILDRMGDGDDSAGLLGSMARVGGRVLGVSSRGRE